MLSGMVFVRSSLLTFLASSLACVASSRVLRLGAGMSTVLCRCWRPAVSWSSSASNRIWIKAPCRRRRGFSALGFWLCPLIQIVVVPFVCFLTLRSSTHSMRSLYVGLWLTHSAFVSACFHPYSPLSWLTMWARMSTCVRSVGVLVISMCVW